MPDDLQGLHIDTDWKKQAQEEKRKLAEAESAKRAASESPAASTTSAAPSTAGAAASPATSTGARTGKSDDREMPPASIGTLVNSLLTQTLLYLGEVSMRGTPRMIDLDMARHNIDLLAILETKTQNNLTPEEQQLLDTALYEARMRFVSVASQYIS